MISSPPGASLDRELRTSTGEASEIMELFRSLIPSLPRVQRAVAEALALSFPNPIPQAELKEEVEALTGEPTSIASVREALKGIRLRFRKLLESN